MDTAKSIKTDAVRISSVETHKSFNFFFIQQNVFSIEFWPNVFRQAQKNSGRHLLLSSCLQATRQKSKSSALCVCVSLEKKGRWL